MEIPDKYHQFFELFEVLGMDRQVNVCNFVRVLALLKIDVNNDQLHINELQIVKQAIQRLFHYLQISTFDEIEKNCVQLKPFIYSPEITP